MFNEEIRIKADEVLCFFRAKGLMIATAESCTGGLISGALTEIAGSSDVVDRGYVTYTNSSKNEMLGVDVNIIKKVGAVSSEVAIAMAEGALIKCGSNITITLSVTGVAGPGQSEDKPAGLVYFGCSAKGQPTLADKMNFKGDRSTVRQKTILHALDLSLKMAAAISSTPR